MQYQLLGVNSGFAAHILSTLLVSWRRMLRGAAIFGVGALVATEVVAISLLHQFPPSLPTHIVALALGTAMAYGVAATIFVLELFRGAIRALDMLEGEAAQLLGLATVTPVPTGARSAMATSLPVRTPQPVPSVHFGPVHEPGYQMRAPAAGLLAPTSTDADLAALDAHSGPVTVPSMASLPSMPVIPIAPSAQSLPMTPPVRGKAAGAAEHADVERAAYDAYADPHRSIDEEPTHPVGILLDNGATVMVSPENEMYAARLSAQPRPPSAPLGIRAGEHEPLRPLPSSVPTRPRPTSQPAAAAAARHAAALAGASPSPELYAPWSVVPPIADPTAKTELSTMAAREAALAFHPVRRPGWWPRRRLRPLPVSGR